MAIKHAFTSGKGDGSDATLVRASNWNADHTMDALAPSGLTGATTASRYVGGTVSGAPITGTFAVNDFVTAQDGKIWICTTAGSPGIWTAVSSGVTLPLDFSAISSVNTRNDEFTGGPSIDGKWTLAGNALDTANVNLTVPGCLYLRRNDTGSKISVYYQSLPTLPCDLYLKVGATMAVSNYARGGGIVLLPATPSDSSPAMYAGSVYESLTKVAVILYSNLSTYAGEPYSMGGNLGPFWIKVHVPSGATTADVYGSLNGYFWVSLGTVTLGFTAVNVGVALSPEGQSIDLEAAIEWFRVA